MTKKRIELIAEILILIGLLVGAFFAGSAWANRNAVSLAAPTNIDNTEAPTIDEEEVEPIADFEPFWYAWNLLEEKYPFGLPGEQDRIWGAIQGLVSVVDDPYTEFFPPQEAKIFNENLDGTFGGIGIEVGVRDDLLVVVAPLKDTPAYEAGLKSGDIILSIDDEPVGNATIETAVQNIRGKKGTTVKLEVLRESSDEKLEFEIVRSKIDVPTTKTYSEDDVFVIEFYNFNQNSTEAFRDALVDFVESGEQKLILDMRGNPGGFLEAAIINSSWFLPEGKVIVREDSGSRNEEKVHRSRGFNIFEDYDLEMIILVDEGTASAGEIMAGALQEHGVAKLLGTETFGKGSVQELIDVTGNTSIKITVAEWLTPNRKKISENGLTPNHLILFDAELYEETGIDNQLREALNILK